MTNEARMTAQMAKLPLQTREPKLDPGIHISKQVMGACALHISARLAGTAGSLEVSGSVRDTA